MIEIDAYGKLNSPIHRWDSRVKSLSLISLVTLCAATSSNLTLVLLLITTLILIKISALPVKYIIGGLKFPLLFLTLMTPVLLLTAGGRILTTLGNINIYRAGLLTSITIGLKCLIMIMLFMLTFGTAPLNQTLKALGKLKVPEVLIFLTDFTYRFIFYYNEELSRSHKAATLRGLKKQSIMRGIKTRGSLFITLLIRGYEHSERIYAAMKLRGLGHAYPSIKNFNLQKGDILKALVIIIIIGLLTILELTPWV